MTPSDDKYEINMNLYDDLIVYTAIVRNDFSPVSTLK